MVVFVCLRLWRGLVCVECLLKSCFEFGNLCWLRFSFLKRVHLFGLVLTFVSV